MLGMYAPTARRPEPILQTDFTTHNTPTRRPCLPTQHAHAMQQQAQPSKPNSSPTPPSQVPPPPSPLQNPRSKSKTQAQHER
ncbi:hypothetical protein EJ06DRAFT_531166 [Trichodelitschia bisporula]|uniref:Uncharacterized protein n=1 Tax=Trichodelitschia bisporula TaxID=703511 RepID=A0A6G1HUN2_9PEZI|nr:hypothetical protein EJ06DRAFT_531166 [Trichodelitschia bisporula]